MLPRRLSIFRIWNGCVMFHQRGDVTHRADVHLRARQERNSAAEVDGEAALDAAKDHAVDALIVFERLLQRTQASSRRALSRDSTASPMRVFDAIEEHLDFIAHDEFLVLAGSAEFAQRNPAFGLQANVDDGQVVLDGNDLALDDAAFGVGFFVEARIEHGREIVAGRGESFGFSHSLTFFQSTYMPGPRKSSQDIPLCA
jgi:hypothetical protein